MNKEIWAVVRHFKHGKEEIKYVVMTNGASWKDAMRKGFPDNPYDWKELSDDLMNFLFRGI